MLRPFINRLVRRNFRISHRRRCAEEDETPCEKERSGKKKSSKGQRVIGISGYAPHKEGGHKIFKLLTFVVGFPLIIGAAINVYLLHANEEEHERPPYVKYEYLNRRTKRFPWGDGVRSLFHNPHKQALPDGTYDEDNHKEEKDPEEE